MSNKHGRLLVRAGVVLFAISLVNGFLAHVVKLQSQAIAAHLVGLIGSVFLISLGLLWSHLVQTFRMSRAGTFLAIYGFCGGWLINFLAAVTGAFGAFPVSVGISQGNSAGDILVSVGLLTVAVADFILAAIVFWGLKQKR